MTIFLLSVSILFQLIAAGMALWFIRLTRRRVGWILMALAILLMAVRRSITLFQSIQSDGDIIPEVYAESVALVISLLMCAGIYKVGAIFRELGEDRNRLKASESRYRSLFDEVSDGIVLSDVKGGELEPNPSALRLFDYSREQFAELHAADLFVKEDLADDPIDFQSLREGKKLLKTRRLVRRDQGVFHAEISSTFLATGQMVAVIRDITARHESDRALRENEAHLRAVLNSVFDAIVTVDLSGTIVDCNRGTVTMFRQKKDRLVGAGIFDLIPGFQDRWGEVESVSDVAEEALRWEMTANDLLGREFPVEVNLTSVALEKERRVVISIRDLTRWKELQAHVLQTQKMDALGTLAGGVAHDFNNVLMVLLGSLEMAIEDVGEEAAARMGLQRALGAAKRGKELVNQILTFSRKEAIAKGPVNVNAMLEESLTLLRPVVPVSIALDCDFAPDLPLVVGDETQLQQIFLNLVTNACQAYRGKNGRVVARCKPLRVESESDRMGSCVSPGDYIELSVQDFGVGISAAVRDRIFDPFFTTKKAGEGTGMGLSVALGIVEQHGGAIDLETEEGVGTTFRVLLPVTPEAKTESAEKKSPLVAGTGQLVMLIDDQESVLLMAARLLDRIGYRCAAFADVDQGLEYFDQQGEEIQIVITDLAMPVKNGLVMASELRARGAKFPIVLTTGNPGGLAEEELNASGVTRLLAKPFSVQELSACLSELLQSDGDSVDGTAN